MFDMLSIKDPEYDPAVTGQKIGPYDINDGSVDYSPTEKFIGVFTDFGETYFHLMKSDDFYIFVNNMPNATENIEAWIIPSEHIRYDIDRKTPSCDWLMAITYTKNGSYYCAVNSEYLEPIWFNDIFIPLRNFVMAGYGAPRISTFALQSHD